MKLMIFSADQKPLESEVADYRAVEDKLRNSNVYGDAVWVTFKDNGEVEKHGQADEMDARNYMEKEEQEFFCEKCRLETSVEYVKGDDVQSVMVDIADKHHMRSYQCAIKYGTSFVRVKSPDCSEKEWAEVTGQVTGQVKA